jgi:branched-chain amino acid transport system substrate-binding protein
MRFFRRAATTAVMRVLPLLMAGIASSVASADQPIRIGALATLQGAYASLGQDGIRGLELAIAENDNQVAGRPIALVKASTDITPDTALQMARKLVELDHVDIIIGPLSGGEAHAVKEYARTRPDVTFIYGAAAPDLTLQDPVPNYFRYSTDGAQWMAGLGSYVAKTKGYHKIVTVAEDYSFPYSMVQGFMQEFCANGGHVPKKVWVPIGQKDFSSAIAAIPGDADAIFVGLVGADAVNFLTQYAQSGGDRPIVGGSLTVDQTTLSARGPFRRLMAGTPAAGPIADALQDEVWQRFVKKFHERFPTETPGIIAYAYYVNAKGLFAGLEAVKGNLADGQKGLQGALAKVVLQTPTGKVSLDANRQAIADNFVTEVAQRSDGTLYNKVVARVEAVNQTLGVPLQTFLAQGEPGRDSPSCP